MTSLCVFLLIACVCDYREHRIPNSLTALMAVQGLIGRMWDEGAVGIILWLGGAVMAVALLYLLFKIGCLGAGDVKLFGVTAGYLPFKKILLFLFFSLLIAAIISLVKMWKENSFGRRIRYLSGYFRELLKNGQWRLYSQKENDRTSGICLAGPVFISILLYLGGVY
ncbi:A24 family peptidase [Acetatifactor muris]|uniref:Type IV leader peptidase family protein n=1 Tax=Acetatifactor muris TaxID=879566 RepID=A0A2K4ZLE9_9FIRM|nr:A24 family peptidase [Acetatifactor muris]MCI8801017.1 prepilin peptidase [Lachnospiraceae bacterium]MCR2049895.1 A24 family peptidase [Acetatifactor muris]SOY31308.1 Type IV leader peptidase family protein [Acetatifactor muris]